MDNLSRYGKLVNMKGERYIDSFLTHYFEGKVDDREIKYLLDACFNKRGKR